MSKVRITFLICFCERIFADRKIENCKENNFCGWLIIKIFEQVISRIGSKSAKILPQTIYTLNVFRTVLLFINLELESIFKVLYSNKNDTHGVKISAS